MGQVHVKDKETTEAPSYVYVEDAAGGFKRISVEELKKYIGVSQLLADNESNKMLLANKIDGGYSDDDGYLYLTSNGDVVAGPLGPFAGGSGGGSGTSNNAVLSVTNTTGWIATTIAENGECNISLRWSSLEDGMSTGSGSLSVKVNGTNKLTKSVEQGDVSFSIKEYLSAGSNTVRVTISDVYGNAKVLSYNISVVSFSLESPFDDTVPYSSDVSFPYTPTGGAAKNMVFLLDGNQIGTAEVTVSGRQQNFTIPMQEHGAHNFEAYFTADVNGTLVESEHLYYDIIFKESGNNNTVIASSFNVESVAQYYSVSIPWVAYTPNSATTDVELYVNDEFYMNLNVDRTKQIWTYRADEVGALKLEIRSATATPKVFNLTVVETDIDVEAEENDLGLYLSSYGRSNNEANPGIWKYGDISAEFQNFNFVSDGWQLDNEQNTVLRLSGDARLKIPYQIFAQDFRTTGKTIEFEIATRDVLDYDAVLLSCMSGGRGIEITTQMAGFKSEQSEIITKYKEEEHVRLAFVVEKRNSTKLLICYINGKISRLSLYPDDDDFSQVLPVDITIGSNDCITDIYNIRVYDNDLTRYQMLDNWIADTQNGYVKKERYGRNNIYNDYGQVTIGTLKKDTPYMVIICPVLPAYKGDKKTCSGYFVDPLHPERNFSWEEAEIDVQGTSSQYYYIKNFKIKFKGGFVTDDNTVLVAYRLKGTGVGTDVFTMKADVASSEGWLNLLLSQLNNELCPVKTPAQEENSAVRQSIDGQPMVIFWNNGTDNVFYGKFNFNNDKGTPEVFGFEEGDESWEILQNGTDRVGFKSADFSTDDWKNDFEARYPEDNTDTTKLQAFIAWVASTNTEAATNETLTESVTYGGVTYTADSAEYRLAKFVAEFADWASVDSFVFYYVFTLVFLCIDQREKNAFPTWIERMKKWIILFYDADSSMGTDNKGNLAFDYWLEDIDFTEGGDPIFNGQNSVLWKNIRAGFWDKIAAEYKRLRTTLGADGRPLLSYEVVMERILAHVNTWCEAIYNEDAYKKYVEPYVLNGDTSYLGMAFGDKVEWAKYWLYNRFRYLDTLFEVGTSLEKRIMFRARAKGNVSLMSYINMYGRLYYNAETVVHRMFKDQEYEFVWGASGAEDAVIGVNDADMITSLGDLSPLMLEYLYAAEATHLGYVKVGDGTEGYSNPYLTTLGFGNNVLMRLVDARNCPNLTGTIDMSGCTGLLEAYFTGTSITGIKLPNGCPISVLHLPNTVANLTFRNLTKLTDFQMPDYSNVATAWIENTPAVDTKSILQSIASGSRVRMVGFNWEMEDDDELTGLLSILDGMRGLDESGNNADLPQLIGTITIDIISIGNYMNLQEKYPDVKVVYNTLKKYTVRFFNGTRLLTSVTDVDHNATVEYPGSNPAKNDVDNPEDYQFTGWSPEPVNVQGDMDCYAQYYDTRVITDDWATVAAASLDGTATEKYAIGAYKPVEINYEDGTSETIEFEVIAHNHDELPDGVKKWEKTEGIGYCLHYVFYNNEVHGFNGTDHKKWDGTTVTSGVSAPPVGVWAATTYNDEIHIFGTGNAHYKWNGTEWTQVSTSPHANGYITAVTYNGCIHVMGSQTGNLSHWKWNGTEWTTVGDVPFVFQRCYAVVHTDEIYAVSTGTSNTYVYNETDGWRTASTVGNTANIVHGNLISYQGELYRFTYTELYKLVDGEFELECVLPLDKDWCNTLVFNNEIYLFGDTSWKWSVGNWELLNVACPQINGSGKTFIRNNELYLFNNSGELHKYDGEEWTLITAAPFSPTGGMCSIYNDELYAYVSTTNANHEYRGRFFKYDWNEWTELDNTGFTGDVDSLMLEYNGCLHVIGGNYSSTHRIYDGTTWTTNDSYGVYGGVAGIVYDNKIHVFTGGSWPAHWIYDGETWVCLDEVLPWDGCNPNMKPGYVYTDGKYMYVNDQSNIYRWDNEKWTTLPLFINYPVQWSVPAMFRGRLYLLGGQNSNSRNRMRVFSNPKADLTFLAKNVLSKTQTFNANVKYLDGYGWNRGGYLNSDLYAYIADTLYNKFSDELKNAITEVVKRSDTGQPAMELTHSNEKIWICSFEEVGCETTLSVLGQGETYPVFSDDNSRIRRSIDGTIFGYWLRSTTNANKISFINDGGALVSDNGNALKGVLIGFCI